MKKLKTLFTIVVAALLFSGCVYNFILPEDVPNLPDPEDPDAPQISFAAEILPIFNDNDNCTACHPKLAQPDLTTENAYNSLNNAKYINLGTPEESTIYAFPHPDNSSSHKKYTETQANLVLGWIIQGAQNN